MGKAFCLPFSHRTRESARSFGSEWADSISVEKAIECSWVISTFGVENYFRLTGNCIMKLSDCFCENSWARFATDVNGFGLVGLSQSKWKGSENHSNEEMRSHSSPQEMTVTSTTGLPWWVLVAVRFTHQWRTRTAQFVSHCAAWTARLTSLNKVKVRDVIDWAEVCLPEVLCCHHIPLPTPTSARDRACPLFSDCDRWLWRWPPYWLLRPR